MQAEADLRLCTREGRLLCWTTLRVITKASGELSVYAGGTLLYTTSNNTLVNAVGCGLYNNSAGLGLVNRWDNFTVLDAP